MPKIYIKENLGKILEFSFVKNNDNNNNVDNDDNDDNDDENRFINIIEIELNENDDFFQKLINDQINWNEWEIKNNQLMKLSLLNALNEKTIDFDDLWHWDNLNQKKHFQKFLT